MGHAWATWGGKRILIKYFFSKTQRLPLQISSVLVDDNGHGDDALATSRLKHNHG